MFVCVCTVTHMLLISSSSRAILLFISISITIIFSLLIQPKKILKFLRFIKSEVLTELKISPGCTAS